MSLGDGGEAGFYATTKVACKISPALNSLSILGMSLNGKCQGLCGPCAGVSSVQFVVGSVKPSPCPRVWVAEEGTLVPVVLF